MKKQKLTKIKIDLSKEDLERLELLEKAHQKKGKQLRVDMEKGDMAEVDELRQLLGKKAENPDEKYQLYYTGISNLLKKYLPAGKDFEEDDNNLEKTPLNQMLTAQLEIAKFQRELLISYHKEGNFDDEIIRKVEQELDIEDMRLNNLIESQSKVPI